MRQCVFEGCLCHDPVHLPVASDADIGVDWSSAE